MERNAGGGCGLEYTLFFVTDHQTLFEEDSQIIFKMMNEPPMAIFQITPLMGQSCGGSERFFLPRGL